MSRYPDIRTVWMKHSLSFIKVSVSHDIHRSEYVRAIDEKEQGSAFYIEKKNNRSCSNTIINESQQNDN